MKKVFLYELKRFREKKVLACTFFMIAISFCLAWHSVKLYGNYEKGIVAVFQEIESEYFKAINNYQLYSIKGFNTFIKPPCASVSVAPEAYEFSAKAKIDVNMDNRVINSRSGLESMSGPYLFILMLAGMYYGASTIWIAGREIRTILTRGLFLCTSVLLIVLPMLSTLFFVPAVKQDLYVSLKYWGFVIIWVIISFILGVIAKMFNLGIGEAIFYSFIFFISLHGVSAVFKPNKPISNGEIHVGKFRNTVVFQDKEAVGLLGIKDKEGKKQRKFNIAKKFVDTEYPAMIKKQERRIKVVESINKKRAFVALISPFAYDRFFCKTLIENSQYNFARDMVELEYDFLDYAWKSRYSPIKPEFKQFKGAKENIYVALAVAPHNFNIAISIYSILLLGLFGLLLFKLRSLPEEEEQELNFDPDFLYFAWLDDEERAIEKEKLVSCGYFPIDKNTKYDYPQDLTFAEIFNLDAEVVSSFNDNVGEIFESKLKKLSKIEFEMGLLAIKISQRVNIVMDNITADYSRKTKVKFASIIDSLMQDGQCVLYLSNGLPSSNLEVPNLIGGKKRIKRPQPFDSENELL